MYRYLAYNIALLTLILIGILSFNKEKTNRTSSLIPFPCDEIADSITSTGWKVAYRAMNNGEKIKVLVSKKNMQIDLGLEFECKTTPRGLIPYLFYSDDSKAIFIRGYGFHYREVILVCKTTNLVVHNYETTIGHQAPDVSYYIDDNNLYSINLNAHKQKIQLLERINIKPKWGGFVGFEQHVDYLEVVFRNYRYKAKH